MVQYGRPIILPLPMSKQISQFLSYVLRHAPHSIGLVLDAGGWAELDTLLAKAAASGRPLDRETLLAVVAGSDKQRFTLSADGRRIRAAQGHSIPVDLGLEPSVPPATLWHGTGESAVAAILAEGLLPQSRRQVHLSPDRDTARRVGMRHGPPRLLAVAAGPMHAAGFAFFRADNGVWLTDRVPKEFLALEE